jgi:hypothetical protein
MLKPLVTLLRVMVFVAAGLALGELATSLVSHVSYFSETQGVALIALDWSCRLVAVLLVTIVFVLLVDDRSVHVRLARGPLSALFAGLVIGALLVGVPVVYLVSQNYSAIGVFTLPDGFWLWIAVLALAAAVQTLFAYGYVYSVVSAHHGVVLALIVSTLVSFGLGWFSGLVPKTSWGSADAVALSLLLALATVMWDGVIAPAAIRFAVYLIGGMGLGVVTLPEAAPAVIGMTALQPAGTMGALALDRGWLFLLVSGVLCLLMLVHLAVHGRLGRAVAR